MNEIPPDPWVFSHCGGDNKLPRFTIINQYVSTNCKSQAPQTAFKQQEQYVGDKVMHSACNQSFSSENHAREKLEKLCQGVAVPPSPGPSENLANRTSQSKALGHPGAKSLNDLPNLAIFSGLLQTPIGTETSAFSYVRNWTSCLAEIASVDNQDFLVDCLRTKDTCYQSIK